jgi:hypothetical protein
VKLRLKEVYDFVNETGPTPYSHSQRKRRAMTGTEYQDVTDPQPFDGTALRDAADGWGEFVDDPELYVAAICVLPTNTGPRKKLYRMQIKPHVLVARANQEEQDRIEKAKREEIERKAQQKEVAHEAKRKRAQLRRKLRKLDNSFARLAAAEARTLLWFMGKS